MKHFMYNLQLFAELNTNLTTSSGLTDEMKTYYSDYLIDNAIPKLVHDQFGQKHPIPKNGGKTIEFRKYSPLPKLTTPITEGVTPDGQSLNMSTVEATVAQYGGYITLSDVLMLTAIDNNLVQATKLLGAQAGATLDTITREVLNGGTNVIFSGGKSARTALDATCLLTVDDIKKAVRLLKNQNAEQISGSWVGIIHPDISYDLTNDPAWKDVKTYSDPSDIYEGEIGKIFGVRFVETTEAKIWAGAGSESRAVYSTLILGDNAYGVTEISGGGLEHIVKQLGSAGTGDPLNQRATAGWKATKVAERLVENYMVRIESASTFNPTANN
ncbi:MAG: N4-gp56 family major capsid protein [Ruminococcaceae bacterium]|nr:N4-gp56 family major capsid protein [Oscillospiraceae bacterium]